MLMTEKLIGVEKPIVVSVIMPVRNAEGFLDETIGSIMNQGFELQLEICIFDDACEDQSIEKIKSFIPKLKERGIGLKVSHLIDPVEKTKVKEPKGVGFAKNRAVDSSEGEYLCFLDADDVMLPDRIALQYAAAVKAEADSEWTLIGGGFTRIPEGSTKRYTDWCNLINEETIILRRFCECTIIMPTWFCHRKVFERVGGFAETGRGTPEDLIFFYKHLDLGGKLKKVDEKVLIYRYHITSASHSVDRWTIWQHKIAAIQKHLLDYVDSFTIWNAGKEGRRFFKSLSSSNQEKVVSFCDVDAKKISHGYYDHVVDRKLIKRVPIIHFTDAKPLVIICVKLDLTQGGFEKNLASMNWTEGEDYYHFS